ncbi:hypothetical protein DFH07DRAFT_781065 [Mycena maculata]|uniref:Uncharacterized protein n=1 Tax=Mycena maculata TaxID=230809 RepID=A0AAD7I0V9_9AGAR|nr:hypothetical protein DFH07DRAFT_781065 [Mycena maculata]
MQHGISVFLRRSGRSIVWRAQEGYMRPHVDKGYVMPVSCHLGCNVQRDDLSTRRRVRGLQLGGNGTSSTLFEVGLERKIFRLARKSASIPILKVFAPSTRSYFGRSSDRVLLELQAYYGGNANERRILQRRESLDLRMHGQAGGVGGLSADILARLWRHRQRPGALSAHVAGTRAGTHKNCIQIFISRYDARVRTVTVLLVDTIINEVEDADSLKSCALTASTLRDTTQCIVLNSLTLILPGQYSVWSTRLAESPHVDEYIRTLRLR